MRRHLPISLVIGLSAVACGDDTAGGSGTGGAGATTAAHAGPSSSSQSGSGSPTSGSGGEGPGATASSGNPGSGGDPGPGPGPGSGGNGGDGGEAPGSGGGGGGDCMAITLDDLAYAQDATYVSAVSPNLVDAATDFANIRFTTAGLPPGDEPGVYDLAEEPDVEDCSRCVAVFADASKEGFTKLYFQQSGTLTLDAEGDDVLAGKATFSLDDVRLVESTLDGDLHSTPVPGGECLYLSSAEFDDPAPSVPAEWECPPSWYSDADCDCGCGVPDPTCTSTQDVGECDTCECDAAYQGFSCAGIVSSADTSQCLAQFVIDSGPISTPFVDNSVACVPLTTGFPGTVARIQAAVVSANHTFVGDLTYPLGPGALAISFMDRPREPEIGNGTPADFAEGAPIVFTDDAVVGAESMGEGLAFSDVICQTDGVCFFRPEPQSFDELVGVALVGQWYFCAIDSGVGDTGEIRRVQVYGTYE